MDTPSTSRNGWDPREREGSEKMTDDSLDEEDDAKEEAPPRPLRGNPVPPLSIDWLI